MSQFLKDYERSWMQKCCANILKRGQIPRHIGIIADGNRRYAKQQNLGSVKEGHMKGDGKVAEVCKMMVDLGIPEVTVFFLSLENLKRAPDELKGMMTIFTEIMRRYIDDLTHLEKKGYGVEVIGDYRNATTRTLRNLFARIMWRTRGHTKFRFNIAFAYGAQDEISKSLTLLTSALSKGDLPPETVDENLLERMFTLVNSNPPDIILRTGGDCRLSDFMTWRGSNAHLAFLDKKWPEFTYCDFLKLIFRYQLQATCYGLGGNCKREVGQVPAGAAMDAVQKWKDKKWKAIMEDATET